MTIHYHDVVIVLVLVLLPTFSVSSFMTAYFDFCVFITTEQKVAFMSVTVHEIIVKPGKKEL